MSPPGACHAPLTACPYAGKVVRLAVLLLTLLTSDVSARPDNGIKGSTLLAGQSLATDEVLVSPNDAFILVMQSDGYLCVRNEKTGLQVWCSQPAEWGENAYVATLRNEGSLCTALVSPETISWCNSTLYAGAGPFFLALGDDAQLCIHRGTPYQVAGTVWCAKPARKP
ncbi:MAG TPA: hypothetical protein VGC21_15015 [Telluria sp.]|jgi:hypothetical protein